MALLEERTEAAEMRAAKQRAGLNSCRHNKPLRSAKLRLPGNTPVNGQATAESAKKNSTSPNLCSQVMAI